MNYIGKQICTLRKEVHVVMLPSVLDIVFESVGL